HLEVPMDVLQQECTSRGFNGFSGFQSVESVKSAADSARVLSEAERPLIFAGGGVIAANACEELIEVAELLQAPVLMSPMGKGAIPADHPLCGGMTFTWVTADLQNMEKSISPLAGMADAALAVGFRFSQLATVNYTLPVPKKL